MLASFGTIDGAKADTMNTLTGAAVCLFVVTLGIAMIIRGMKKGGNRDGQIEADKGE